MDERWTVWPAWDAVGTHLRFAPALERLAGEYLLQTLNDRLQPFIAIRASLMNRSGHPFPRLISSYRPGATDARHGDFGCPDESDPAAGQDGASCFRSPASYLPTIEVFRSRLAEDQNVEVSANAIVVFSDETDERWWSEVAAMGWQRIDHSKLGTARRFDNWWPVCVVPGPRTPFALVCRLTIPPSLLRLDQTLIGSSRSAHVVIRARSVG